jgi:hypothetical protein
LRAEVTAGDLLARDTVVAWMHAAGLPFDVAVSESFRRPPEVALEAADPARYDDLVFVCGPVGGDAVTRLFDRFAACRRVAIGVSVVDATTRLEPLTVIPRDCDTRTDPDLSLWAPVAERPVVGVIRAHAQPEYGHRQRHDDADAAIDRLLARSDVAPVSLDTRLDPEGPEHCGTADQLMSALGRVDAVITTRLHGLVLALKAGVPVLAIDPILGGAKVTGQAHAPGAGRAVPGG